MSMILLTSSLTDEYDGYFAAEFWPYRSTYYVEASNINKIALYVCVPIAAIIVVAVIIIVIVVVITKSKKNNTNNKGLELEE